MAKLSRNFIAGRMNKSVDERLVPNGEYIDALNVRLGSTEDSEIGSVENAKGNEQLTTLNYLGTPLSTSAKCIGAYDDSANENIYWFVHDPAFVDSNITGKLDLVVSYNTTTEAVNYHVISMRKQGSNDQTTLNFDPFYLITGVSLIENLLYFTDNLNQPREIDITKNYENPDPTTTIDGFTEEAILVIKKPPLSAPTFTLFTAAGDESFMEERFICFAYRWRYANNQYSATSPFTKPAFIPNPFQFDSASYLNEGMTNSSNAALITYNTGGPLVVGIDLLFKESDSNVIKIIEKLNKNDLGLLNNRLEDFAFDSSKIFTILPDSELLRLYDNVPLQAQAQTLMGNRLMYGNYYEGYDMKDCNGAPVRLNFRTSLVSEEIGFTDIDTETDTASFTIDGAHTQPDGYVDIPLSQLNLVEGSSLSFDITFSHGSFTGAATPTTQTGQTQIQFTYFLQQDFPTATALITSPDFQEKIGIGAPNNPTNIEPVDTACDGTTLTDQFNCAVAQVLDANNPPSWTKFESGIDQANQAISATAVTATIAGQTTTFLRIQLPAMRRVDNVTNPTQSVYEYFEINIVEAEFQEVSDASSLHSNRDYEIGIIYMDDFGRASTAFVSPNNAIHIPCANSEFKNSIQVNIPPSMKAPAWATRYKFCIKPAENTYQTIYSNIYFTDPSTVKTYFLLDGENARKVEVGDRYIVKTDSNGPVDSCAFVTVLEKGAEERDFLGEDNPPVDTQGNPISVAQGVYMSMKVNNFSIEQGPDSFISPSKKSETSGGNNCYPGLAYGGNGVFGRDDGTGVFVPFDIPGGSRIRLDMRFYRKGTKGGDGKCERREFNYDKEFTASQTYDNIIEWWEGDNIKLSLEDDSGWNNGGGVGPGQNVYIGQSTTDGGGSKNCLSVNSNYYDMTPELGKNFFAWYQDPNTDEITFACTGTRGCGSSDKKDSKIEMKWTITRAENTIVFETLPSDALPNVWFESSDSFAVINNNNSLCIITVGYDSDEGPNLDIEFFYIDENGVEQSVITPDGSTAQVVGVCGSVTISPATPPFQPSAITILYNQLENCNHLGNIQSQTSTQDAIVLTDFYNCFAFGNGVESYRARDSFEGRSFNIGERVFTTDNEDYRREHRFADITYSGLYNDETNLNNLNQFNLGLLNFKPLEERYGAVMKLAGRQTDILTLQEDKISYVLTGKNLLSDSAGGGSISSVPEVLGTQIARTEEYGISFNPESYAEYGYNKFFTDSKRGAVLQLRGAGYNNEQLTVISEANMRSWFRDLFIVAGDTQKLGAYDPYMNEYVLSSNIVELPVEDTCLACGVTIEKEVTAKGPTEYCVELPNTVGTIDMIITINQLTPNTTLTITEDLNSTTFTATATGNYTFTFAKSNILDDKVNLSLETTIAGVSDGSASVDVTVNCPETQEITVIQVCVTPNSIVGETVHNEFEWTDGFFTSPTTSNLVLFGDPLTNSFAVSQFESYTAAQGYGPIPLPNSDVTITSHKILPADTFNFNADNKLKYLYTDTQYAGTFASVVSLLSDPNINNLTLSGLGTQLVSGTFTLPATAQDYLYLVYDYRESTGATLCYDANTAFNACCDCSCDTDCNTWEIRNYGLNAVQITILDCSTEPPIGQSFELAGRGSFPYTASIECSELPPIVALGDGTQVDIFLSECGCDV